MDKREYSKPQYRKKGKYSDKEEDKHYQPKRKYIKKTVIKSEEQGFTGAPEEWFNGTFTAI